MNKKDKQIYVCEKLEQKCTSFKADLRQPAEARYHLYVEWF